MKSIRKSHKSVNRLTAQKFISPRDFFFLSIFVRRLWVQHIGWASLCRHQDALDEEQLAIGTFLSLSLW